jgi:amino acid transporter
MASQPAQLQREALGLRDVVFQGITHIAPALNVVFTLPVIAAQAGATMPLSLLLSTIVCFFIANTVAQFSRYVPSERRLLHLCLTRPGTTFRLLDNVELSYL